MPQKQQRHTRHYVQTMSFSLGNHLGLLPAPCPSSPPPTLNTLSRSPSSSLPLTSPSSKLINSLNPSSVSVSVSASVPLSSTSASASSLALGVSLSSPLCC